MHNDNLSYAETFSQALDGLFSKDDKPAFEPEDSSLASDTPIDALISQAQNAFDNYLRLQSEKKFDAAAKELQRLQDALERLSSDKAPGRDQETIRNKGGDA
jgi:hypothetical protein